MLENGFEPEPTVDPVIECLASDDNVMYLAEEIMSGELELDIAYPIPTDRIEFWEVCKRIMSEYDGVVTQSQIEQAIEHAKTRLTSGDI